MWVQNLILEKKIMDIKIQDIEVLENKILKIFFSNNIIKNFDCKEIIDRKNYYTLNNEVFFNSVKIDKSKRFIYWNDEIDICENELWTKGVLEI